jgi:FkbM family methyltransferase
MNKSLEIIETQFGNFIIDEYDLIGNFIKNNKVWEYHLYEIYSSIITPEYYCIDAGANLGFHSIQFGRLGKKVYSFEPQRYIFNQLSTNILLNGLDNIIDTHRVGLGNKEEIQQLWNIEHEDWVGGGAHNWGGRGIIQEGYGGERANKNEIREEDIIKVISLDSLNISKCNLIKIDVQGYEYYLLEGANKLINKFKPILFLENPILGEEDIKSSLKTKEYLLDMNYDFYRIGIGNKDDCIVINKDNPDYQQHLNIINKFSKKYNIVKEQ